MAELEKTKPVVVEMTDMKQSSPTEKEESTVNNSGDIRYDPKARARAANMTSYVAVACNITLTVVKYIAGYFGNSAALIADAFHSLSDLASDFICIIVSCIAQKPADLDHPYGHGRVEMIGSVGVSIMLLAAAFFVGKDSIEKMVSPDSAELEWYTSLAALFSILVNEGLYWYAYIVGKKIDSPVIIANAWHHRTDALSSVVALVGTVLAYFFHWTYADPIASLAVALMIAYVGIDILWKSICSLADRIPVEVVDKLNSTLATIPGVEGYSDVRAREMGAFIVVDLKLYVHPGTHVEDAEEIQNLVEQMIKKEVKNVSEVMVRITTIRDEKNTLPVDNITTQIRNEVMKIPAVKEITQIRVFGPEPYSVDLHIICNDFSSFCEQHQALHEVKRVVNSCASMKAVHVGLECCDEHEVHCDEDGPCVVINHEHPKEAVSEDMPTENV